MKKTFFFLLIFATVLFTDCAKPPELVSGDIIINELLPVNKTIAPDQNGQYDDWIELYNLTPIEQDISGYYLSNSQKDYKKWKIPAGTTISANGFLIIWADKDIEQLGLHANFKLSSQGEEVFLTSSNGDLIDDVKYPAQTQELSYSRNPDGSGAFQYQTPTFDRSNNSGK
jgi:hypothetical protein